MTRRLSLLTIQIFSLVLLLSLNVAAQDRDRLQHEIQSLREQLEVKEDEFLAPSEKIARVVQSFSASAILESRD